MVVPVPAWVRLPLPEMALPTVRVAELLKASALLLTTLPVPSEPVAPPLPTCSVPPEIVVEPL